MQSKDGRMGLVKEQEAVTPQQIDNYIHALTDNDIVSFVNLFGENGKSLNDFIPIADCKDGRLQEFSRVFLDFLKEAIPEHRTKEAEEYQGDKESLDYLVRLACKIRGIQTRCDEVKWEELSHQLLENTPFDLNEKREPSAFHHLEKQLAREAGGFAGKNLIPSIVALIAIAVGQANKSRIYMAVISLASLSARLIGVTLTLSSYMLLTSATDFILGPIAWLSAAILIATGFWKARKQRANAKADARFVSFIVYLLAVIQQSIKHKQKTTVADVDPLSESSSVKTLETISKPKEVETWKSLAEESEEKYLKIKGREKELNENISQLEQEKRTLETMLKKTEEQLEVLNAKYKNKCLNDLHMKLRFFEKTSIQNRKIIIHIKARDEWQDLISDYEKQIDDAIFKLMNHEEKELKDSLKSSKSKLCHTKASKVVVFYAIKDKQVYISGILTNPEWHNKMEMHTIKEYDRRIQRLMSKK